MTSYTEAHQHLLSAKTMDSNCVDTALELKINTSSITHQTSTDGLVEELTRIGTENKKLTKMLSIMSEEYCAMHIRLRDLMSENSKMELDDKSKKRKAAELENGCANHFTGFHTSPECNFTYIKETCKTSSNESNKKTKISTVRVPIDASDSSLVVKDGYHWRKYGQKVTRDNPSPRAYFRCSFAPGCPVKKRVQRSAEDPSILVTTYEGEHNHQPNAPGNQITVGPTFQYDPSSFRQPCSTITLNLNQVGVSEGDSFSQEPHGQGMKEILVQQMANSLTKDPKFTAALLAALSGKMLHHTHQE